MALNLIVTVTLNLKVMLEEKSKGNSNVCGVYPLGTTNVCTKCQGCPSSSHGDISVRTKLDQPTDQPTLTPKSQTAAMSCSEKAVQTNTPHPRGFTFRQWHSCWTVVSSSWSWHLNSIAAQSPHRRCSGFNFASLQGLVIFSSWDNWVLIPVAPSVPATASLLDCSVFFFLFHLEGKL